MMEGVLWHKVEHICTCHNPCHWKEELTPGRVGMQGRLQEHNGIQHGGPSVLIEQAYPCNALLH